MEESGLGERDRDGVAQEAEARAGHLVRGEAGGGDAHRGDRAEREDKAGEAGVGAQEADRPEERAGGERQRGGEREAERERAPHRPEEEPARVLAALVAAGDDGEEDEDEGEPEVGGDLGEARDLVVGGRLDRRDERQRHHLRHPAEVAGDRRDGERGREGEEDAAVLAEVGLAAHAAVAAEEVQQRGAGLERGTGGLPDEVAGEPAEGERDPGSATFNQGGGDLPAETL